MAAMRARDAELKARAIELASAAGDPAETLETLTRILREARARS